jgi:ATP-independent RNA helicase DbpA
MNKPQHIIDRALKSAGFESLNELQRETIDAHTKHNNLLILSQTGSGKTLAFLLPTLCQLNPESNSIQALILAPSRELAIQIENVFKSLKSNFKVLTCYGGHSMRTELNSLTEAPAVLIGTPGRICDHITRGQLDLSEVKQLVIDEYDKCLEFGFEDQMKFIQTELTGIKNTFLVSATELKEFPSYLAFNDPGIINHLDNFQAPDITYFKVSYTADSKFERLFDLLCTFNGELTIVFCNFREATETIVDYLNTMNYEAVAYHGGMEQEDRERALIKFRNGSFHTLVCTDLGSRGLDIPEIQHVVHFQYPQNQEAYIHRNGRTARMKANGSAYLMINKSEEIPDYLDLPETEFKPPFGKATPVKSPWVTLYFSAGKKDKINKIDLVGFLGQKGSLQKHEIGLITVQDRSSFVAVPRKKVKTLLETVRDQKVKGQKLRIAIAR